MGWSNYIIIPEFKLAIEVSRYVEDIEEYEKDALYKITEEKEVEDVENVKVRDITVKDLTTLYNAHEIVSSLTGFEIDKLLLFWLQNRGIEYKIKSEFEASADQLKNEGYTVIHRS
ncbi:hypothetical protein ig2599ANME_1806 [groundwater metagenome]